MKLSVRNKVFIKIFQKLKLQTMEDNYLFMQFDQVCLPLPPLYRAGDYHPHITAAPDNKQLDLTRV